MKDKPKWKMYEERVNQMATQDEVQELHKELLNAAYKCPQFDPAQNQEDCPTSLSDLIDIWGEVNTLWDLGYDRHMGDWARKKFKMLKHSSEGVAIELDYEM